MKANHASCCLTVALSLFACSCVSVDEMPSGQLLAPMPKPQVNVGDTWHSLEDGEKEVVITAIAVNGNAVVYRTNEGCEFTESDWGFGPATQWSGCRPFEDGTQTITAREGNLWPLKVGNEVSYDLTGTNVAGGSWDGTRSCNVESQVSVATVSGKHDTFKVVCSEPWAHRTWYISPIEKTDVLYIRTTRRPNRTNMWELTKFEPAPTS